jgi:membrane fusion protein, multidrug efflux system
MAQDSETAIEKTAEPETAAVAVEDGTSTQNEQGNVATEGPERARRPKAHRIVPIIIVAAILAAVAVLVWRHYAAWVSTDDAEVEGYIYPISARISGHVIKVTVENTEYVDKGTVLVQLDPTDYQVAVDSARAQLANAQAAAQGASVGVPITSINTLSQVNTAQADVDSAQAGIAAAEKQFQAAEAKLREAEANNVVAQQNVKRYGQLVGKYEISQQEYDNAVATAEASAATVAAAQASAAAAEQQVAQARSHLIQADAALQYANTRPRQMRVIRARSAAAVAAVEAAEAALHKAELNLQYTTVVAPVNGVVGRRTVVVGENVQTSQALMAVVPIEGLWITANFKETQLKKMHVGQPVNIHVDAYDRDYSGHVDGIGAATGAQFSLLPPENATGNYVKVVQRVPVRVLLNKGEDRQHRLRVGMSVEPHVRVN